MTKHNTKSSISNTQLKAQRPPEAMWLWLPRYRNWQRHKKPVASGDWLAFDVGLFLDPKKRAIWSGQGPEGLAVLLGLMSVVGSDGDGYQHGLTWGDHKTVENWLAMSESERRAVLVEHRLLYSEDQEIMLALKNVPTVEPFFMN